MGLVGLAAEVKELGELDPSLLSDTELSEVMVELHRLRAALDAQHARIGATWNTRSVWAADGARSGAAWMATRTRAPRAEYASLLWLGSRMRSMTHIAAAWEAGEITTAHVRKLVRAWNPRVDAEFVRDEAILVHHARTLRFDKFCQTLDYWSAHADPDGTAASDEERRAQRRASLDETISGMWSGSMLLDPISGTIVSNELHRIERQLFDIDWAKAKNDLGREPRVFELARTADQRRADALVEMANRSAAALPAASAKPLFTVLLGADTFKRLCEIEETGKVISPEQLREWIGDANLEAILFDTLGTRVLEVSRQRGFTGALRRAVEVRDRECFNPYCTVPASRCQVDHVTEYAKGGLTSQDNGRLACGHHNRARNRRCPPPLDDS